MIAMVTYTLVSTQLSSPYLVGTIPMSVPNSALVRVEDRQFFSHYGIDPIGIVRALWSNLSAGHVVQGGSTLT
ncbi:hypothetical protein TI04_06670, partial [Achromatium sp. WMS2]